MESQPRSPGRRSLSTRLDQIQDSPISGMAQLTRAYDVINLAQGFPDFDPPPDIIEAAVHALRTGHNQYAATYGSTRFRQALAANHGMLFVFHQHAHHCMWMRNTMIPLSVAFIGDDGTVVNVLDMKPHDERSHCATAPVRYALEMTQGWFAQRGIGPGSRLGRLPVTTQK